MKRTDIPLKQTDALSPPISICTTAPGMRRVAVGAAWMIAARWAIRGLGIVSTIILARLLRPEDFGLVAMGAITVQFVLVFADAGQALAVIRDVNATDEHFDTAWSMSIITGFVVAAALITAAPLAGAYFHEPRAVAVVQFTALKPLINGFTNVGVLSFRKDLHFGKDFQFLVVRRLATFMAGVSLGLLLRSYWALVIANVCGEVLGVAASYWLSPYRPRFRLPKLREIWRYSAWMQFASIGFFLGDRADQFIVGGLAGTTAMGLYNVSADTASAPTDEIVVPMARALFPYYARLQQHPTQFAKAYLDVLSTVAVIALSTGVGVALVARDLVTVVLGQRWLAAAPLVVWLALGSAALGIGRSANAVLTVSGSGRLYAVRNWLFVALLVAGAIVGAIGWGPVGVAAARCLATLLFLPFVFYTIARVIPIDAADVCSRLWRPVLATAAMGTVVSFSGTDVFSSAVLRLFVNAGLGASTFIAVLLALWVVSGCEAGIERSIVEQADRLRRRHWRSADAQS